MAVLPEDVLASAREIKAIADPLPMIPRREALHRISIGRAYYAAYDAALRQARSDGWVIQDRPPGLATHEALWEWWYATMRGRSDVADLGRELKRLRITADYRPAVDVGEGSVATALGLADRLLAALRR